MTGSTETRGEGAWVALLRGVNVGGRRRVPMAELRALAAELGWRDAATYVQSGNLVLSARGTADALARALAAALEARFGFAVPVAVCAGADWLAHARGGVFPEAERARPKLLHLGLAAGARVPAGAARALAAACTQGEEVAVRRGALWVDYRGGVARSKVTPAALDRAVGAPVTLRNWSTVQALAALVAARADSARD